MRILYSSLHNLDMKQDNPVRKTIPADFNSYMDAYIKFATKENSTSREYNPIDSNRMVLQCVSSIFSIIYQGFSDMEYETLNELADSIAMKLLDVEKAVQERIGHMTDVQKGSIVQALLVDNDNYKYVIAKVEHSEWYDGETLEKNFGFPGENKRVWKSAVINIDIANGDILFSSIKVFVNHPAKYWSADFLEVKEAKTDAINTKTVLHATEKILKEIKGSSLQDYYSIRNTIVHELQSAQIINYTEMVGRLLDNYVPVSNNIIVEDLKEKLLAAREKYGFDTQFHTDPKAIKGPGKIQILISPAISVLVKEGIPNWENHFFIREKADGRTFIMIRCDNPDILSAFPKDEE